VIDAEKKVVHRDGKKGCPTDKKKGQSKKKAGLRWENEL
jgi:hypothetical protein